MLLSPKQVLWCCLLCWLCVCCTIQGGWSSFEPVPPPRGQISLLAAAIPVCRAAEFPQLFRCALEDAELWGEPPALLWTHPPARSCIFVLPVQHWQVGSRDGGEIKHMAGASSGRRCELFPAVYRLQKPSFPTLPLLLCGKPRFCC